MTSDEYLFAHNHFYTPIQVGRAASNASIRMKCHAANVKSSNSGRGSDGSLVWSQDSNTFLDLKKDTLEVVVCFKVKELVPKSSFQCQLLP